MSPNECEHCSVRAPRPEDLNAHAYIQGLMSRPCAQGGGFEVVVARVNTLCLAHSLPVLHIHTTTVDITRSELDLVLKVFSTHSSTTTYVGGNMAWASAIITRADDFVCAHQVDGDHASAVCPRSGHVMAVSMVLQVQGRSAHVVNGMQLTTREAGQNGKYDELFECASAVDGSIRVLDAVKAGGVNRARTTTKRNCNLCDPLERAKVIEETIHKILNVHDKSPAMDDARAQAKKNYEHLNSSVASFKGYPFCPVLDAAAEWIDESYDPREVCPIADIALIPWYARIVELIGTVVATYPPKARVKGPSASDHTCATCTRDLPARSWCPTRTLVHKMVVGTLATMSTTGIREVRATAVGADGSSSGSTNSSLSLSDEGGEGGVASKEFVPERQRYLISPDISLSGAMSHYSGPEKGARGHMKMMANAPRGNGNVTPSDYSGGIKMIRDAFAKMARARVAKSKTTRAPALHLTELIEALPVWWNSATSNHKRSMLPIPRSS